jgi:steroid delta-isomerase-like uncharacterized protein
MRRIVAGLSVLVLAAVLIVSANISAAQEASPAAPPATLPPPLAEWAAAYSSGDADRLLALYTDDALWEEVAIGLAAHGQDEIRAHLDRLFTAVPDFTVDVNNGFVAGDQAVVEWVISGTYSADFPGLPPAAGQHFSLRGASVFELTDGKIRRYTEYWDAYAFLVQLGALPATGTAAPGTPMP